METEQTGKLRKWRTYHLILEPSTCTVCRDPESSVCLLAKQHSNVSVTFPVHWYDINIPVYTCHGVEDRPESGDLFMCRLCSTIKTLIKETLFNNYDPGCCV